MMKRKHIQGMICLAIFILFANWAWAAQDWIPYATIDEGAFYYDSVSIRKINKSSVIVWTILMPDDKHKKALLRDFESLPKAPDTNNKIDYMKFMTELDCVRRKYKPHYFAIINVENQIRSSYYEYKDWQNISPDSSADTLINKVCGSGTTSGSNRKVTLSREQLKDIVNKISKTIPYMENEYTTATGIELMSDNVILWKYRIDKNALINSFAEAKNMSVRQLHRYIISEHGSVDKYFELWKNTVLGDTVLKMYCNETPPRSLIDGGVIFKHAYYEKQGSLIQEIYADQFMCDAFEKSRVERCLMFCETNILDTAISFFRAHKFW
jgi:hypothetical protein